MASEPIWKVSRGGKEFGPYSLAQLKGGLETGRVSSSDLVCRLGGSNWVPISADPILGPLVPAPKPEVPQLASSLPPAPAEARPAPPPQAQVTAGTQGQGPSGRTSPTKPRRVAPKFWIGLVALLALAVTGVAAALLWKRTYTDSGPLARALHKLPAQTQSIEETVIGAESDYSTVSSARVASELAATACGGADVANSLGLSRGRPFAALAAEDGVIHLLSDKDVQAATACGEAFRATLEDPRMVEISFDDGGTTRSVALLLSSLTAFPAGTRFVRHNMSSLEGYCERAPEGDSCKPDGHALFRDGTLWGFGTLDDVQAYARAHTTAREETTTNVEILQQLAAATPTSDTRTLTPKPKAIPWGAECRMAAPVEEQESGFLNECFPTAQGDLLESIATRTRGVVVRRESPIRARKISTQYVLLARDDEAANAIEKDLIDFARDWKAHVTNSEPKLIKLLEPESGYVHDEFWRAALPPLVRALKSASVARHGTSVTFTIEAAFTEAEGKLVHEFEETRAADRAASSKIIEALAAGAKLPEDALGTFMGPVVANWMMQPRATADTCKKIRERLAQVVAAGISPAQYGNKFAAEKQFTEDACDGIVLPIASQECLLSAKSLDDFSSCDVPHSPFDDVVRKRLTGQWEVAEVDQSSTLNAYTKRVLAKWKIEFDGKTLAALTFGTLHLLRNAVTGTGADAAELAIPYAEDATPLPVTFADDDTFVVKGLATFKRAQFARSLLAPEEPQTAVNEDNEGSGDEEYQ